ncbi:MAG TPA: type II CAAX endopeptidase family protein [Candidatus Acidoferrum sp.]|nr:type II CAAX endopeptidase family protein [Candidatus Acidoferrum sp.]
MSLHEEYPPLPGEHAPEGEKPSSPEITETRSAEPSPHWGSEVSATAAATEVAAFPPAKTYPEDLQISWSWVHFLVFLVFTIISLAVVPTALVLYYAPHKSMTADQFQRFVMSKPEVGIGSTIAVYAAILLFLYVTLSVLRGLPFWSSLGWRKIQPREHGVLKSPPVYFFTGCALSILVFGLTAVVKPPENTPIEEVFKVKETAILFVAMAMLVAPLVEETVFRGYLYPMFARWFGVGPSIIVTGVLFGLMHGPQVGWAKSIVALLIFVGIAFTFVRSRTGSVFASYLMHLGYNSLIGISLILETHGFTKLPTGK